MANTTENPRIYFTVSPEAHREISKAATLKKYRQPNAAGKFAADATGIRAALVLAKKKGSK